MLSGGFREGSQPSNSVRRAVIPWEKNVTVSSRWPRWSRLGPNDHGSVTARRGHSLVTVRSQLSHGEVTAQSRHLQYDHGSVTARSQLNHGPGHGSVTAGCDHFGHRELTVSSHGGQFFSHGMLSLHYSGVIMSAMASQIISLAIVYSIAYSGADQRKHQSSASLAFVRGIHRWPVNSPHKGPVTRKMFPFDDVIMDSKCPDYMKCHNWRR